MMTDKKRIICIEDEPETTNLMKLILAREGYEVLGANGGEEGLALVNEQIPDLILLDLMMPEMDGTQVFQRLKENEETRDIPVIVVTAKVQSIDIVLWRQVAKVDDYITKPFRPEERLSNMEVNVINRTRSLENPLRVKNCESFLCRLKGLMFQNSIEMDAGLLMIYGSESLANTAIHMFFVGMDLGVIWLDSSQKIVDKIYLRNSPGTFTGI